MFSLSVTDARTPMRTITWATVVVGMLVLVACAPQDSTPAAAPADVATPAAEPVVQAAEPTASPEAEVESEPTQEPVHTADAGQYAEMAADVEAALDAFAADHRFSGTVLVARNGEVVFAKGYGYADRLAETPNDVRTRFRLGSLTKQFTAMAVLMLHERGLLDINDPICGLIENCPDAWAEITVENLLTHTGGVPDFTRFPDYETTKGQPSTLTETIDRFRDVPLDFAPGERWDYTNSGYILLGQIIERVTGLRYEDFIRESLFGPLGMTDTGYDHNRDDLAVGYVNAGGAEADYVDMSIPHAAGALYSSAEDMLKWDRGLADGTLLSDDLQEAMFTAHASIPDSGGLGYGYGWVVGEQFGQPVAFHSGGIEGFSANITRFPDDGTLIVMLSNEEQTNPQPVIRTVMQALYAAE